MAQKSDELERELEVRRQILHARVSKLRARAADDVTAMQSRVTIEVETLRKSAEAQVAEHPFLSLAGGFGLGLGIGTKSPTGTAGRSESSATEKPGLLSEALGSLTSLAGGTVVQELRTTIKESLSDLLQGKKQQEPSLTAES